MTPSFHRTLGVLRRGCVPLFVLGACVDVPPPSQQRIAVVIDSSRGVGAATLVLKARAASQLREWSGKPRSVFTVSVAGSDSVAVAGTYATSDTALEFTPMFPLDIGRAYSISIGSSRRRDTLMIPPRASGMPTHVVRVLPSADSVPANLLRLYLEFSAPMSRDGAIGFVHLLDGKGVEVQSAFLPVDGDFWNADHTRYTLFLDPGRVKRGILPNEQIGRPLSAGRTYTLRVDSTWRDGKDELLGAAYNHVLKVGAADLAPIQLADWKVSSPGPKTVEKLVVRFPEPLDNGLLRRALGVERLGGTPVEGTIEVDPGERVWRFAPKEPWKPGEYQLVVLSILEDVAGNRVNRQFEADRFDRADSAAAQPKFAVRFSVR